MELTVEQKRAMAMAAARKRQMEASAAPAVPAREGLTVDDVQGFGQRLLKGQTMGFGDEIAGVGRAALDYLAPSSWDEDAQSFGDKYRMYRDDARATDKQFQENNPGTALVTELVGGVASPVNKIAPGFGSTGGIGTRLAQSVARGGAEGAVYGAGESENNLLSDVATGAGTGAALSGLLTGAGGVLGRTLSKRRIDEDLLKPDGSFMPIHLADKEHGLGEFYRNTVGTIPYAKGKLREQEKPFLDGAQNRLDDISERWRQNKEAADNAYLASVENIKSRDGSQADTIRDRSNAAIESAKDSYSATVNAVKDAKEVALPAARQAARARATQQSDRFMQQAYDEALPPHARSVLEGIDRTNPRQVEEAVSDWWLGNGFREVKDNTFRWRGDVDAGLMNSIRQRLSEDPDLAIEAFKSIPSLQGMAQKLRLSGGAGRQMAPQDYIEEMLRSSETTGISGDALMALRNQFAMASNKSGNGRAPRAIANEIDDFIRDQLNEIDPALTQQFNDQLGTYTTALTLKNVLRKKRVRQNMGRFGADDWMGVSSKFGGKGMSLRQPPLEDAARATHTATEAARDVTAETRRIRAEAAAGLRRARQEKADAIKRATQEKSDMAGMARRNTASSLKQARQDKSDARKLLEEEKRSGGLSMAKEELKDLEHARVPQRVSPWSALASTAILGAPISFGVGALPAGISLGTALATQTGQRAVAGQTSMQAALAKALREGDTAKYTQILSRFGAGQAAGE